MVMYNSGNIEGRIVLGILSSVCSGGGHISSDVSCLLDLLHLVDTDVRCPLDLLNTDVRCLLDLVGIRQVSVRHGGQYISCP